MSENVLPASLTGTKLISTYYIATLQQSGLFTRCPVGMTKDTATPLMSSFEVRHVFMLSLSLVFISIEQYAAVVVGTK
jgi:hypothetical protein